MNKTFLQAISERDLEEPLRAACARYGATVEEVAGRSRVRHSVLARADFVYFLREELGWSYPTIGALLDRDHTTIIYLHKKAVERWSRARVSA